MRPARAAWSSLRQLASLSLQRQLGGVHGPSIQHPWLQGPCSLPWQACAGNALPQQQQQRGLAYRLAKVARDQYTTPPKNYVQLLQHIHHAYNLDKLYKLMQVYSGKFDSIHVAAAMSMMPKLYRPIQPGDQLPKQVAKARIRQPAVMLDQLQDMALSSPERLFSREIANILYALGRCRGLVPPPQAPRSKTGKLTASLLARLRDRQHHLLSPSSVNGQDVAQLLYGLARLRLRDVPVLLQLRQVIKAKAAVFEPKEIAAIIWAMGRLKWRDEAAVAAMLGRVKERYLYLRPLTLSAMLNGLARLGYRDVGGLDAQLSEVATDQIGAFTPRLLGSLCHSLSRMPRFTPSPDLLAAINRQAVQQLEQYKGDELGQVLDGLARVGGLSGELAAAVAQGIAQEEKVQVAPVDARRILSAFVRCPEADLDSEPVQRASLLISQALLKPTAWGKVLPHDLTHLSICFSKLGSCEEELLDAFGDAVVAAYAAGNRRRLSGTRVASYSLEDLQQLLQSFNRLGHLHEGLCSVGNAQLERVVKRMPKQQAWLAQQQQPQQGEQQQGEETQQQQQLKRQLAKQLDLAVDLAQELAAARRLRPEVANTLAAAARDQLEEMRPRKLAMLLRALSSKSNLVSEPQVRELFNTAAAWLRGALEQEQELGQLALAGLPVALAAAIKQGLLAGSGPDLVGQLLVKVEPLVGKLRQEEVVYLIDAAGVVGGEQAERLQQQLKEVARERGWEV